ncbi:hypothetical protein ACLMJK_005590 [Lecanora helva]
MPICKYFASPNGCTKGDTCYFQHAEASKSLSIDDLTDKLQQHNIGIKGRPFASASSSHSSNKGMTQVPCRFFANGNCKNGDKCQYRHAQVKKADTRPRQRAQLDQSESSVRDLGGAVVKFGDGAEVNDIKLNVTDDARLQLFNVTCSWYQPSKIATLKFTSSQAMNDAAKILGHSRILNRALECRTAINKKPKPWECFVKVGNLDVSTSVRAIKDACGNRKPSEVTFGAKSYSSSALEIGNAVRELLSSSVELEAWSLPAEQTGMLCKATATLRIIEDTRKVIRAFNGYKVPQLAGSSISLSHMVKAKFSTLTSIYEIIKHDLTSICAEMRSSTFQDIKIYPSKGLFTTIHVISSSPKEVAKAKTAIQRVLHGHTARSGSDVVWHKYFLKRDGVAYLNALGKEHDAFIHRNAKKCELILYGSEEQRAVVESSLIKAVEDLALSNIKLDISEDIPTSVIHETYRKIASEYGKLVVKLNIATTPKTIIVEASSGAADRVHKIFDDTVAHPEAIARTNEGSDNCVVCWCDVTGNGYTTPCGHVYDRDCFVSQCSSADDSNIPIRCFGAEGCCQTVIPFSELELILNRDELQKLLSYAFTNHIRTHPAEYQYCPTASCDQIYRTTDDCQVFTCSTCLTSICTTCNAISHEGLTCEQNKNAGETDESFAAWKKESGAKDCPRCGSTIKKNGGCRHMCCSACGAHVCWVCLRDFKNSGDTYDHLVEKHGGIFGNDILVD